MNKQSCLLSLVTVTLTVAVFYGLLWFTDSKYDLVAQVVSCVAAIAGLVAGVGLNNSRAASAAAFSLAAAAVSLAALSLADLGGGYFFLIASAAAFVILVVLATKKWSGTPWIKCFPFYLTIPLGVGGSMYLYLIEMVTASYWVAGLSISVIIFYGMYLELIGMRINKNYCSRVI